MIVSSQIVEHLRQAVVQGKPELVSLDDLRTLLAWIEPEMPLRAPEDTAERNVPLRGGVLDGEQVAVRDLPTYVFQYEDTDEKLLRYLLYVADGPPKACESFSFVGYLDPPQASAVLGHPVKMTYEGSEGSHATEEKGPA